MLTVFFAATANWPSLDGLISLLFLLPHYYRLLSSSSRNILPAVAAQNRFISWAFEGYHPGGLGLPVG